MESIDNWNELKRDNLDQLSDLRTKLLSLLKIDSLYDHQLININKIIKWEEKPFITNSNSDGILEDALLQRAIILAENVGSGKTIMCMSIIAYDAIRKFIPTPNSSGLPTYHIISNDYGNPGFIKCYWKKVYNVSIVCAGTAQATQWFTELSEKSKLNVKMISNITVLDKLNKSKNYDDYDVILIPNSITKHGNTLLDQLHIYEPYSCWKRIIIDDVDVVQFKCSYGIPCALSYIFPIAKPDTIREVKYLIKDDYHNDSLMREDIIFKSILLDPRSISNENMINRQVRCEKLFVKECIKIPNLIFYEHKFKNPERQLHNILNGLGVETEILDGINNDAFNQVSEELGLRVKSPFDLAQKIINENLQKYNIINELIGFVNEIDNSNYYYGGIVLDEQIEKIKNLTRPIKHNPFKSDYLKLLNNMKQNITVKIENIKDNLEFNECQVCGTDLLQNDTSIIMKCCQYIFCQVCAIDENKARANGKKYCPNCNKIINFNDLIIIPLKLLEVLDVKSMCAAAEQGKLNDIEQNKIEDNLSVSNEPDDHLYNKNSRVLDIINNKPLNPTTFYKIDKPNYVSVVEGSIDVEYPKDLKRKVIIFGLYNTRSLEEVLQEQNIKYDILIGNVGHKAKVLKAFKNGDIDVLITSARTDFSGFNCQYLSDIIFMGNIRDKKTSGQDTRTFEQALGRSQRIGKKYNCNVHLIRYDTESKYY